MDTNASKVKVVYQIVERSPGKSFWNRVGVGFTNADGSLNLKLDSLPLSGTLQVRDWEPRDADRKGADESRPATLNSSGAFAAE